MGVQKQQLKLGWYVDSQDHSNSCFLARVYRPHQQLLAWGIDSQVVGPATPTEALRQFDVIIFHRSADRLGEVAGRGIILGFDLADDLFRYRYAALPVDFLLTDSLPNTRFYQSPVTHYWPHGFPDLTAGGASGEDSTTRFVYCGAPENVHCLLGDPLEALEQVGARKPLSLRIITSLDRNDNAWLAGLPRIEPRNFKVEWVPFEQDTHESLMKECHVGFFPQYVDMDRWRKKSIYKPAHAASLGLPSVSTPTEEAMMNFLDGQSALLPDGPDEWVAAVELMTNAAERNRIRKNVIELYRLRFTIEMATQQLLGIVRLQTAQSRRLRFKGARRMSLRIYVLVDRILSALQKRFRRS